MTRITTDLADEYETMFTLTPGKMRAIVEGFKDALELGLEKPHQTVAMIPTYIPGWPTGKETGDFLAVDLGGTNLRVCLVTLLGHGKFDIAQAKYRLSEEQKHDDGQKLFDFCADCLKNFIDQNLEIEEGTEVPLGFTFSYPCAQDRIDQGVLLHWTKGFGAPNTEGRDVAAMFRHSLAKHVRPASPSQLFSADFFAAQGLPVKLAAIVNDTAGTLIASHYVDPRARIAVIFGTGCNAAYMERMADIPKMRSAGMADDAEMAINCEWGAFDSFENRYLPRTKYDLTIDKACNKPGEQIFEKLISGLYLGEIFRIVLCELKDDGLLFENQDPDKLQVPYAFETAFLSLMESDQTDELLMSIGIFSHFFSLQTTLAERRFFRTLARLICRRAARLGACGIAAIVSKMGYLDEECVVVVDGSLYNLCTGFSDHLHEGLEDIFGDKGRNIKTYHAQDGSGVGSAIIAAMTTQQKNSPAGHARVYPPRQS
ncbi:hypothetical protein EWM64_g1217 [Hericium alpestre]|uniref:Phosphotransferase n=1 Tax=Hericium alpestre TaxID=135208 RepID=A0A4Z0A8Y5_9AGAM|nr:hypothetical protein EWM64_g1217 [Hericium alpestre]